LIHRADLFFQGCALCRKSSGKKNCPISKSLRVKSFMKMASELV
jgi:hypothetical protein